MAIDRGSNRMNADIARVDRLWTVVMSFPIYSVEIVAEAGALLGMRPLALIRTQWVRTYQTKARTKWGV